MSWLTLVALPVILLLYIQVVFLPYHDVAITWTHRVALLVDIAMLVSIGVFLMRAETSFMQAFMRTTSSHPVSFLVTILLLAILTIFSFFIATIPGETLDRVTQRALGIENEDEQGQRGRLVAGFALPFLTFGSDGSLFGIFRRNLIVTDTDLVIDKEQTPGEPSLSLRGRDLRFAKLDRSDLHQADMTGADLRGASLVGTDLSGVWMQCADVTELLLQDDRAAARCTTARRAIFNRANLSEAHMVGVDLRNAKLEESRLDSSELAYSLLTGASFSSARLDKADLTGGVQAMGANFLIANLQGADLTGALLQDADFSSASLQAAILNHAHLEAANLRDSDLEGASLIHAHLAGADMAGAKIAAADLRSATVWMTRPPEADTSSVADFAELAIRAPGESEITGLKQTLERIYNPAVRGRVAEALAPIMNAAENGNWAGSADQVRWSTLAASSVSGFPDTFKDRLTEYLGRLQCKARWSNGAVAVGIARRAMSNQFRGDLVTIYDRLRAEECPATKSMSPKFLREFTAAADVARGN